MNALRDASRGAGTALWLLAVLSLLVLLTMHSFGEADHDASAGSELSLSQGTAAAPSASLAEIGLTDAGEACGTECSTHVGDLLACMTVVLCAFLAASGLGLLRVSQRFWLSSRLGPPSTRTALARALLHRGPDLHVLSINRT
ncbi:hypothetical protein M4I32_12965 [Microbacterium sp. LRZ72]|uniref:hypothetical protein n=1 Tax=Microbacterium sp. LRZ72 TaxID=2942481 RepID=UPI0029ABE16A|nr:hypothetical protein [Microbacterium sp. LRZ72]MDX2377713.1 hypothetical protein [Microbacterium sp. LRZ72]